MKQMLQELQAWWSALSADDFELEVIPASVWIASDPAVSA